MLNLQSNAIKFTPQGGHISIICKFIREKEDLENEEQHALFDPENKQGMIQVSVTDSGIGIREQDKSQLFKLFGFLDSTKAINTQGIGLGLHISKMIAMQFGGDIMVKSKWGFGSKFTFVLQLSEKQDSQTTFQRHFNPIKKKYPKITISKAHFELKRQKE